MTTLASKSVPQPTKRGPRPERQTNMSALPYMADDRVVSCRTRTGPQRDATSSTLSDSHQPLRWQPFAKEQQRGERGGRADQKRRETVRNVHVISVAVFVARLRSSELEIVRGGEDGRGTPPA